MLKIITLFTFCLFAGIYASVFGNVSFNKKSQQASVYYQEAIAPESHRAACNNLHNKNIKQVTCKSLNRADSEKTDLFLWGDSHASAMVPGLTKQAEILGFNLEYAIMLGCQAVLQMQRSDGNYNCAKGNERIAKYLDENPVPFILFVSSYVHNVSNGYLRSVSSNRITDNSNSINEFADSFNATIDRLKSSGVKIAVITEAPRFSYDPVIEKIKHTMVGRNAALNPTTIESHYSRIDPIYSIIDNSGIDTRLDYTEFFCPEYKCTAEMNSKSLYKDRSHISNFGSTVLSKNVVADLEKAGFLSTEKSPAEIQNTTQ